jgi:uncharacterized protein with ParB-like and HNH nuclease domain
MSTIETRKHSIQQAFRECFYVVPDYQREYVWTDKEVNQLLDDIDEQVNSDKEYFIGTVLVSPNTDDSQINRYDIIDGQQRLTTFFLLLCVMKHLFENQTQAQGLESLIKVVYFDGAFPKTNLKLEPRYENADKLLSKLVELNANPETLRIGVQTAGIQNFGSLENILKAYETAYAYLSKYDDANLKDYFSYLMGKVVFIQIATDVGSSLKIFETINQRGIGLDPMDLLKNLLFTNVKKNEFEKLKNNWKKITAPLEKKKEKPLRFLRYFLMANYQIKNDIVQEDKIYDWLISKENILTCNYKEQPFEFVDKIISNVSYYINFIEGKGIDGNTNVVMENIKLMGGSSFSLHYILLLAASSLPNLIFNHFIKQLETFLFYYIFTKTPTKDLERDFSKWADELRVIGNISDLNTQKNKINSFITEYFQKKISEKEQELSDALNRYSLNTMQQYRTRYLLAKITQYVDKSYRQFESPLKDYMKLDIEHIMPNQPPENQRMEFKATNSNIDYDIYKNKLGNLTLLEKPINIVASNCCFFDKKSEYCKSNNYLTSSIVSISTVGQNTSINRINEKLKSFDNWNAESIDERQKMLINLAREVWSLKLME